eukprot:TRINITY_DN8926_c0_g1_i1.p1 TRINITY_DN8926_c0_g1~~TRINITY_DN8926_c0_g1_i1.p1  ORF type:complete len:138 (+),score=20.96 TRINITY_DN8926_c0_g1_i1:801-1214(+)
MPSSGTDKTAPIGQVEAQQNSLGTTKVTLCNTPETLLASSIPHLQLNYLSTPFNSLDFQINSDSGQKSFAERLVCQSREEAAFTDATVANQDNLENIITLVTHQYFAGNVLVVCSRCVSDDKLEKSPFLSLFLPYAD